MSTLSTHSESSKPAIPPEPPEDFDPRPEAQAACRALAEAGREALALNDWRDYRVKAYLSTGKPSVSTRMRLSECHRILDDLVRTGQATGGHIEHHVAGIGWVVEGGEA